MITTQLIDGIQEVGLCQQLAVNGKPQFLRVIGSIAADSKHRVLAKV